MRQPDGASVAFQRCSRHSLAVRFEDLTDYFKLRRLAANPMEIVRFRKRQMGSQDLEVQLRGRPSLHLRGGRADFHMFHRIYLRDEYRLLPLFQKRFGCVVDLGGNVGIFSSRIAPYADRVITCEPVPVNFERLTMNLGGYDNVERLPLAVTDKNGKLDIYLPIEGHTTGVFSAHREGNEQRLSEQTIQVDTVSFQDLMQQHAIEQIDLLKIDIEGGEYDVLYPAVDLLPRVQRIHGEYHDVRADDPRTRIANFASFLKDNGFKNLVVEEHKKMPNHGMFFASR